MKNRVRKLEKKTEKDHNMQNNCDAYSAETKQKEPNEDKGSSQTRRKLENDNQRKIQGLSNPQEKFQTLKYNKSIGAQKGMKR